MDIRTFFEQNKIQHLIKEYLESEQLLDDLQEHGYLRNHHFTTFINEKYHLEHPYHPDLSTTLIGRELGKYEKSTKDMIFKKRDKKGVRYIILQPPNQIEK